MIKLHRILFSCLQYTLNLPTRIISKCSNLKNASNQLFFPIVTMNFVVSHTVLAVLAVDLLALAGDTTATWTSPMYIKLYSNDTSINPLGRPITEEEDTWIGSIINIGAMIGPFFYGFIAHRFGRKVTLLSIAIPHFIAYVTLAFAKTIYLFYFARLLSGFAVGGGYTLMPMYIAEITEPSNRGMLSVTLNIFWTFGNLLSYLIGPYLSAMWFNLVLACFPVVFLVTFFFIGVETPYYLVSLNRTEEAKKLLVKLRTGTENEVEKELDLIKTEIQNQEGGKFLDLFQTKGLRKGLYISLLLIIFQQLSGINAFLYYLQTIFEASGTTISSDISSIICGLFLFASSFTTPFVADRLGRRILMIVSCFGMIIALAIMGAFFYLIDKTDAHTTQYAHDNLYWMPILGLVIFILFFNFGLSPVPWTLSSELFPTHVKSAAASAVSSTCWITSFIVTKFFKDVTDSPMGRSGTFWMFGGFCLLALLFTLFVVPETKGKRFEEIQEMLED